MPAAFVGFDWDDACEFAKEPDGIDTVRDAARARKAAYPLLAAAGNFRRTGSARSGSTRTRT